MVLNRVEIVNWLCLDTRVSSFYAFINENLFERFAQGNCRKMTYQTFYYVTRKIKINK